MNKCVVKEWVWTLPLMMQTVLLSSLRGPDGCHKVNSAKDVIKRLRPIVIHNANNTTEFMALEQPLDTELMDRFIGDWDAYPFHFVTHLLHAAEIVGYCGPTAKDRSLWLCFYRRMVSALHLSEETAEQMSARLSH